MIGLKISSINKSIKVIDDVLEEMNRYSIGKERVGKKKTRRKIDNLDAVFWETIKTIIGEMLVKNYNAIRITNSPKYWAWKKRAQQEGLSVKVTDAEERPVQYVRPALRTGYLREVLRKVEIDKSRTISNVKDREYAVAFDIPEIGNLYREYGDGFRQIILNRTGDDILMLREDQMAYIFELVISKYSAG